MNINFESFGPGNEGPENGGDGELSDTPQFPRDWDALNAECNLRSPAYQKNLWRILLLTAGASLSDAEEHFMQQVVVRRLVCGVADSMETAKPSADPAADNSAAEQDEESRLISEGRALAELDAKLVNLDDLLASHHMLSLAFADPDSGFQYDAELRGFWEKQLREGMTPLIERGILRPFPGQSFSGEAPTWVRFYFTAEFPELVQKTE